VSPTTLTVMRPLLRYSLGREAYVLRLVGGQTGPVLRPERRRKQLEFDGPDRRGTERAVPDLAIADDLLADRATSWPS
jgi:hypothetical protein